MIRPFLFLLPLTSNAFILPSESPVLPMFLSLKDDVSRKYSTEVRYAPVLALKRLLHAPEDSEHGLPSKLNVASEKNGLTRRNLFATVLKMGFLPLGLAASVMGNGAKVASAQESTAAESGDTATINKSSLSSVQTISDMELKGANWQKLPSGAIYYDVRVGQGTTAEPDRSIATLQWVLRRQNGYFVDSSANYKFEPFIYRVGNLKDGRAGKEGEFQRAIRGLDEAVQGMKEGGIRRVVVPPAAGYTDGIGDGFKFSGPIPPSFGPKRQLETRRTREPFFYEIELTKVKNVR